MASKFNGKPKPKKEEELTILDRMMMKAIGDEQELGNPNDPIVSTCPNVFEAMTRTDAGENYVKTPATIRIAAGIGKWLITLTDMDLCYSREVAVESLLDAFTALEKGIVEGTDNRKVWGKRGVTLRKKRKPLE